METSTVAAGGWPAALRDEKIGEALNFMHSNPGHASTIESLGKAVACRVRHLPRVLAQ